MMLAKKITTGFVIQTFDVTHDKFISQEFVAGDQSNWEDEAGVPMDEPYTKRYLAFDMVQPPNE